MNISDARALHSVSRSLTRHVRAKCKPREIVETKDSNGINLYFIEVRTEANTLDLIAKEMQTAGFRVEPGSVSRSSSHEDSGEVQYNKYMNLTCTKPNCMIFLTLYYSDVFNSLVRARIVPGVADGL